MTTAMQTSTAFLLAVLVALVVGPTPAAAQLDPELGLVDDGEPQEAPPEAEPGAGGGGRRDAEANSDRPSRHRTRDESQIEAFRIGLGLRLFEYEGRTLTVTQGNTEFEQSTRVSNLGLFPAQLGLTLGGGFAEHFFVGSRLELRVATGGATAFSGAEQDAGGFGLGVLPFFEYVFNPEKTVAWMAYGQLGVRHQDFDTLGNSVKQTVFVVGAGLGAHIFFAEGVSFDPALEFSYSTGSGTENGIDYDVSGIVVGLEIGLSVWL